MKYELLTQRVIGCFFTAYNELGFGFTEGIYAGALEILFREADLHARREHVVEVLFRGRNVGRYRLDFLIDDVLVLELKAGHQLPPGSRSQLLTYLRTSKREVGLVLFFGPTPEIERVVRSPIHPG